jgi:hypothetical protein
MCSSDELAPAKTLSLCTIVQKSEKRKWCKYSSFSTRGVGYREKRFDLLEKV